MALAASRYFLPVTRELMTCREAETPIRLIRRTGFPKSPAYRVIKFYEVHGALRTQNGLQSDPRRILALQGGLRADRAIPDKKTIKGPPLEEAAELLEGQSIPYAIGFQTAANMHAYFEPAGAHTLWIQGTANTTHATRLTAKIQKAFTNHPAASDRDPYEFYVDDLKRLELRTDRRRSITSPIQTLLDLAIHSNTGAHKEFLFDQLQKQEVLHG